MKTERDKLRAMFAILASVVILLAAPLFAADPPAAPEPVELKTLRMEYQQRLMKAQTPADDWYRMQLRTLLTRYKQSGNLDAAVTAQAEMENPDPSKPVPADKPLPPDLAGIRNTYVVNAQRLTQPVAGWYKQQLESLKTRYTREGRLAEAQAIDRSLAPSVSPSVVAFPASSQELMKAAQWKTPKGGRVAGKDGELSLKGPGDLPFKLAFALSDTALNEGTTVAGEMKITGGGGVVLAATRDLREVLFVSTSTEGTRLFHVLGPSVKLLSTLSGKHHVDEWVPFEIERKKSSVRVKIGTDRTDAKLGDRYGTAWGITTFETFSVSVRSVSVGAR